jgi:hypothetical protein
MYKKILSLTLLNALLLMFIGCFLSSCQNKGPASIEHFFHVEKDLAKMARVPASVQSKKPLNDQTLESYIYCKVSDVNPKKCFKENLSRLRYRHKVPGPSIDKNSIKHSYKKAKKRAEKIAMHILKGLKDQQEQVVQQRIDFCQKHAKKNYGKCLRNYLERDAIALINHYQKRLPDSRLKLTGIEYLYLSKVMKTSLSSKKMESI